MQRFSYFFMLLINTFLYSQEIKITVVDSLNQSPIQEAIALDTSGQFLTKSNNEGVLFLTKDQNKVYITANGYKQTMISLAQNENFICKINKNPEELEEVFIGKKQTTTKYGNTNLSKGAFGTDSQVCRPQYKNLTCATKIIAIKKLNVTFYNFCVYEKTNNSPFNFLIYNDNEGKPNEVVYSQYVKNYKKGWNQIAIDNKNLKLLPGVYYIAMQWIPLADKSDVWEIKYTEKTMTYVGQSLGINKGDDNQLESFIYRDNWEKAPRLHTGKKGNYTQYIEALEN
jgi:hypothetical protein